MRVPSGLDLRIILLTFLSATARERALQGVAGMVGRLGGPEDLVRVAARTAPLAAAPPPGAREVVRSRTVA